MAFAIPFRGITQERTCSHDLLFLYGGPYDSLTSSRIAL